MMATTNNAPAPAAAANGRITIRRRPLIWTHTHSQIQCVWQIWQSRWWSLCYPYIVVLIVIICCSPLCCCNFDRRHLSPTKCCLRQWWRGGMIRIQNCRCRDKVVGSTQSQCVCVEATRFQGVVCCKACDCNCLLLSPKGILPICVTGITTPLVTAEQSWCFQKGVPTGST